MSRNIVRAQKLITSLQLTDTDLRQGGDITMFTNLRLSIVWVMDRVRIEALKLFWWEQNDTLVAVDLCIEILLLIVMARSHVTCT